MWVLLSGGSAAQFLTVLIVFIGVLGVTAWVTKWMAGYQKQQSAGSNIEVIETTQVAANKYIQLIRVGETYMAIAVCKDTVTMLGEVPAEQLKIQELPHNGRSFREWLDRAVRKNEDDRNGSGDIEG